MVGRFRAGGVSAGIKKTGEPDLGIIYAEKRATAAAVFTRNRVQAAPVLLTKNRVKAGSCRAVVVNSGNANCCTGGRGMEDAEAMARSAGEALGIPQESVLVASTGVIGKPLPVDRIAAACPALAAALSSEGWPAFSRAIMTTDTVAKMSSRKIRTSDGECTIIAAAKGVGMLRPDMATMLCFAATDAEASHDTLQAMLQRASDASFNRITVDGDTSTNDTVILMADGASGVSVERAGAGKVFQEALNELFIDLAKQMVRDGEGATKLVEVRVEGASSLQDARRAAETVADSSLVKTALFGEDANWGRIMAALGRSGAEVAPEKVDITFDEVFLVRGGQWAGEDAEASATRVMKQNEFTIRVDLHLGEGADHVWTCDFSVDYVKINADYRT